MNEGIETVIVGGGQAGLAMSHVREISSDNYLESRGAGSSQARPSISPMIPASVEVVDLRASHIRSVVWAVGEDAQYLAEKMSEVPRCGR